MVLNADFPRILSLLRKEKGISQKQAASDLGISQALLSHYEKGIRECGLDFLIRCADYYQVSCDYLLGRSPERSGTTLHVEDLPDADAAKENSSKLGLLPLLNKKLITNSLNILFDLAAKTQNKGLVHEISGYLMFHVYKIFRFLYHVNSKNQSAMFTVHKGMFIPYCDAAAKMCEANIDSIVSGYPAPGFQDIKSREDLHITTESLAEEYPLYTSSLLNLVQNCENRLSGLTSDEK